MSRSPAIVQQLRKDILSLSGLKAATGKDLQKNGLAFMQDHFPQGCFPAAAVHEFITRNPESGTASAAFISGIIARCLHDHAITVWIVQQLNIYPPALTAFGLDPARIVFIYPSNEKEAGWCAAEALQCQQLTAVVAEMHSFNFTNSRRFQLAVEKSKVTGFMLNTASHAPQTTAFVSRWQIDPLPGHISGQTPGVGYPKWNVQLQKMRNGKPGQWEIAWINNAFYNTYQPVLTTSLIQSKTG